MVKIEKASLTRLFSGRHFLKGKRRLSLIWSGIASIVFCLILLNLFLIFDLLHTKGNIQVPPAQGEEFDRLLSSLIVSEVTAEELLQDQKAGSEEEATVDDSEELAETEKAGDSDPSSDEPLDQNSEAEEQESADKTDKDDTPEAIQPILSADSLLENPPVVRHDELRLNFEESGILPSVWWSRNTVWGYPLAEIYQRVPWLHSNGSALIVLVLTLTFLGLLYSLLVSRVRAIASSMGLEVSQKLRRDLYRQALRLGPADLCEREQEHVVALFLNDSEQIRDSVETLVYRYARDSIQVGFIVLFALSINWLLALQCIVPLGACWYLIRQELQRFREAQLQMDSRAESTLRLLAEGFRKTRLVRAYNMERAEHDSFQRRLERLESRLSNVNEQKRWSRWFCRALVVFCTSIVLILVCMKSLLSGDILPMAAGLSLLLTLMALHIPLKNLFDIPVEQSIVSHAADRIYRYLDKVPPVSQAVGAKFLSPLAKSLSFESVSYRTEDNKSLLDKFDLSMSEGESIAIVSLNPLEAMAAAYLIPRFIEPTEGRVLIDGEDIAWGTLESLRTEVGYVGGNDQFFTGSVIENIRCGNAQFTHTAITDAAKQSRAHNFILRLPHGYETMLGEHGEQLSAGQGFRLGLARAVLRNPALLIIAEPTEKLDSDTKSRLDDTYQNLLQKRTVIFLPTRLSTVRRVDRIIMIHEGKVESIGTHAELVKNSPIYRHWEYMRFNAFREE